MLDGEAKYGGFLWSKTANLSCPDIKKARTCRHEVALDLRSGKIIKTNKRIKRKKVNNKKKVNSSN